jgi:thiol-disulfide isomerase/thioredoxin
MKYACTLLALALAVGCSKATRTKDAADADVAESATDAVATSSTPVNSDIELAILGYQGIMEQVAEKRGKVVVMDAWSTSCPPCMKEFHNLVEIHKEYGPEKVACISLSFDYEGIDKPEDQAPRVLEFLQQQGATFDNLMSTEESDELYKKFNLAAVPAVFVYDQEGKLRKRFDNEQAKSKEDHYTYDDVKALVAELVAREKSAEKESPDAKDDSAADPPAEASDEPTKQEADE